MLNHRCRVAVAISILALTLGMAFIPTLIAQRVSRQQPQPQGGTLKTLTLDGKRGNVKMPIPPGASRRRALTQAEKVILFKAKLPVDSFKLTPADPAVPNKANLFFINADVFSRGGGGPPFARLASDAVSYVGLHARLKVGKLYALDFDVYSQTDQAFTVTNIGTEVTQTTPGTVGDLHITAYVMPEGPYEVENLYYQLTCPSEWTFYSVEITEL
jgi:hypothetical protein